MSNRPTSSEAANALAVLTAAIGGSNQQTTINNYQQQQQQFSNLNNQSTLDILRALGLLPNNNKNVSPLNTITPSTSTNNNQSLIPSPLNPNTIRTLNSNQLHSNNNQIALPTRSGRIPQLPNSDNRDTLLFNEWFDYNDYNSTDDEEDPDFNPINSNQDEFDFDNWDINGEGNSTVREGGGGGGKRKRSNKDIDGEDRELRNMMEGDLFSNDEENETDFSNFDEHSNTFTLNNHPTGSTNTSVGGHNLRRSNRSRGVGDGDQNSSTTLGDEGLSDTRSESLSSLYGGFEGPNGQVNPVINLHNNNNNNLNNNNNQMDIFVPPLASTSQLNMNELPRLPPLSSLPQHQHQFQHHSYDHSTSPTAIVAPLAPPAKKPRKPYTKRKSIMPSNNQQQDMDIDQPGSPTSSTTSNLPITSKSKGKGKATSDPPPPKAQRRPYFKKPKPELLSTSSLVPIDPEVLETFNEYKLTQKLLKKERNSTFQREKRRRVADDNERKENRLRELEDENKEMRNRIRELGGGEFRSIGIGSTSSHNNNNNSTTTTNNNSRVQFTLPMPTPPNNQASSTHNNSNGNAVDSNASWSPDDQSNSGGSGGSGSGSSDEDGEDSDQDQEEGRNLLDELLDGTSPALSGYIPTSSSHSHLNQTQHQNQHLNLNSHRNNQSNPNGNNNGIDLRIDGTGPSPAASGHSIGNAGGGNGNGNGLSSEGMTELAKLLQWAAKAQNQPQNQNQQRK